MFLARSVPPVSYTAKARATTYPMVKARDALAGDSGPVGAGPEPACHQIVIAIQNRSGSCGW